MSPVVVGGPSFAGGSHCSLLSNTHPALRRCWLPVARSEEVTEAPSRVLLAGEALVAYRHEGRPTVLFDRCPHRFAPLSLGSVVEGSLECAYHGWRFAGDGRCTAIPSLGGSGHLPPRARVEAPFAVTERYGLVFVAIDEPLVPLPELELFDDARRTDPECRYVVMGPYEGRFGAGLLLDNQLDVTHFPFLHRGTFGATGTSSPPRGELVCSPWGFSMDLEVPISAPNDPAAVDGAHPLLQHRAMSYRYLAPFHLLIHLEYPVMGGTSTIVFFAQPETDERARLYVTVRFWQPGGFTDEALAKRIAFEERVVSEDLELQGAFDALALPLDPSLECHVRADRAGLEYRRILRNLVTAAAALDAADRGGSALEVPVATAGR